MSIFKASRSKKSAAITLNKKQQSARSTHLRLN